MNRRRSRRPPRRRGPRPSAGDAGRRQLPVEPGPGPSSTPGSGAPATPVRQLSAPGSHDRAGSAQAGQGLFGRGLLYVVVLAAPLFSAAVFSPILTHVLGPSQFGLVSTAISLNQLLMALAMVGLDQAVLIQRAEDSDSSASRGLVATSFLTTAVVMGLAAATAPWWMAQTGLGGAPDVVWLTLAWTTPAAPVLIMGALLVAENRLRPFTVLSLISTTAGQAVALGFVLVGRPVAATYLEGALTITLVSLVVGTVLTRPRVAGLRDVAVTWRALGLGLPMALNATAGYVLNAGDRILIQRTLGSADVGRYQVAYTIGSVVVMLMFYVGQSWAPRFAEVRDARIRTGLHESSRNALYRILAPSVLGVTLAAPVALRLLAPATFRPQGLSIVVALIAVAAFAVAAGGASGRELLTLRRGRALASATVAAAVVNVLLNLVLLPRWGIVGAAVATLVAFCVQSVVKRVLLPREPSWPGPGWRLWLLILGSSAAAGASTLLPDTTPLMGVRFALGLACLPWFAVELRRARA